MARRNRTRPRLVHNTSLQKQAQVGEVACLLGRDSPGRDPTSFDGNAATYETYERQIVWIKQVSMLHPGTS